MPNKQGRGREGEGGFGDLYQILINKGGGGGGSKETAGRIPKYPLILVFNKKRDIKFDINAQS